MNETEMKQNCYDSLINKAVSSKWFDAKYVFHGASKFLDFSIRPDIY